MFASSNLKTLLMKHIYILTTFLFLLSSNLVSAQTFTIGDLEYTVLAGTTNVEVGKKDVPPSGALNINSTVMDPMTMIVYTVTQIKNDAFISSTITSVNLPNTITIIGSRAFQSCQSLTSVVIPNSVTTIADSAFGGCTGLTSVTIPSSVTAIGDHAFSSCFSLTSISLPSSITTIEASTFFNCIGLVSFTIPSSVTVVGSSVFRQCTSLASINIPSSVTSIGELAFINCTSLTSVTIPSSVTTIASSAFDSCISLASINIPNTITNIGTAAFINCTSLTSVTIPSSVTSIDPFVFFGCTGLTEVNVNWDTPLTITANVFQNVILSNIALNVPSGKVALYEAEAVWQDFNPIHETPTLSATEFELNKRLKLYPNPSKDFIQVSGLAETEKYSIYNVIGVEVAKGTIVNNNSIAIQHLTNGMYFLKFDNANSIKFIKE